MKCLVEIYDNEQVNNLISILSFKPQKAVFLYDKRYTQMKDLESIERACIEHVPNISFEFVSIDTQNLDDVQSKCKKIIRCNRECVFDITGGDELSVIGAYLSCINGFNPVFKLDIDLEKFINVYGCNELSEAFNMPEMNLSTMLLSKGARLNSCLHPTPEDTQFGSILSFCNVVFNNVALWKELCTYIQNGTKTLGLHHKSLKFDYGRNLSEPKTKLTEDSGKLLVKAKESKLISELELSKDKVQFSFNNDNIKRYMTDFGSWLELYSYITLRQSGLFRDVKMSVRIGWDGEQEKRSEVINEVDVTFFSGIIPVFVSCKLSDPSTEALQELSVYRNYFGGRRSKCILVTAGNVRVDKPHILHRAHEMGIHIIDRNDINSGKFLDKIKKILGLDISKKIK